MWQQQNSVLLEIHQFNAAGFGRIYMAQGVAPTSLPTRHIFMSSAVLSDLRQKSRVESP